MKRKKITSWFYLSRIVHLTLHTHKQTHTHGIKVVLIHLLWIHCCYLIIERTNQFIIICTMLLPFMHKKKKFAAQLIVYWYVWLLITNLLCSLTFWIWRRVRLWVIGWLNNVTTKQFIRPSAKKHNNREKKRYLFIGTPLNIYAWPERVLYNLISNAIQYVNWIQRTEEIVISWWVDSFWNMVSISMEQWVFRFFT